MDVLYDREKRKTMTTENDAVPDQKHLATWANTPDTAEHPLETKQDKLDGNQRARISKLLFNFDVCGFQATNCIFRENIIEIYYVLEECDCIELNKEELKQNLAFHLRIEVERLKLTKLRAPPVFKETSINPGDRVRLDPPSQCSVGAFVNVNESSYQLPALDPLWERFDRKQLIASLCEITYKLLKGPHTLHVPGPRLSLGCPGSSEDIAVYAATELNLYATAFLDLLHLLTTNY